MGIMQRMTEAITLKNLCFLPDGHISMRCAFFVVYVAYLC